MQDIVPPLFAHGLFLPSSFFSPYLPGFPVPNGGQFHPFLKFFNWLFVFSEFCRAVFTQLEGRKFVFFSSLFSPFFSTRRRSEAGMTAHCFQFHPFLLFVLLPTRETPTPFAKYMYQMGSFPPSFPSSLPFWFVFLSVL